MLLIWTQNIIDIVYFNKLVAFSPGLLLCSVGKNGVSSFFYYVFRSKKPRKRARAKISQIDSGTEPDVGSDAEIEEKYENEMASKPTKKVRTLLPIKTKEGLQMRSEEYEGNISFIYWDKIPPLKWGLTLS